MRPRRPEGLNVLLPREADGHNRRKPNRSSQPISPQVQLHDGVDEELARNGREVERLFSKAFERLAEK